MDGIRSKAVQLHRDLQVADFHQNRGAFGFGEGAMVAHVRAADPGAGGIGAVLVAEDAREDEDFLPADVGMWIKPGIGSPADEGGVLGEALMEGGDFQARDHALPPIQTIPSQGKGAFLGFRPVPTVLVQDAASLGPEVQGLAWEEPEVRLRSEVILPDQKATLDHQEFAKLLARVRPGLPGGMRDHRDLRMVALLAFQDHRPLPLQGRGSVHHDALGMIGMQVHALDLKAFGW